MGGSPREPIEVLGPKPDPPWPSRENGSVVDKEMNKGLGARERRWEERSAFTFRRSNCHTFLPKAVDADVTGPNHRRSPTRRPVLQRLSPSHIPLHSRPSGAAGERWYDTAPDLQTLMSLEFPRWALLNPHPRSYRKPLRRRVAHDFPVEDGLGAVGFPWRRTFQRGTLGIGWSSPWQKVHSTCFPKRLHRRAFLRAGRRGSTKGAEKG